MALGAIAALTAVAPVLLWPWSYSCKDAPVTVHPIAENWNPNSIAAYPGPSYGSWLASRSFANGWSPDGSSSACPAKWESIDLGSAGDSLVQAWVNGTKTNHGLTVRASTTSSSGWKKFASRETPNDPYLAITYNPDNATYAFADSTPVFNPPILNNQAGYVKVKVTNKGRDTWTTTGPYKLSYQVFDKSGKQIKHSSARTAMPSDVAYGQTATVNAKVNALPPGAWKILFDMIKVVADGPDILFSDWYVPRTAAVNVTVPMRDIEDLVAKSV